MIGQNLIEEKSSLMYCLYDDRGSWIVSINSGFQCPSLMGMCIWGLKLPFSIKPSFYDFWVARGHRTGSLVRYSQFKSWWCMAEPSLGSCVTSLFPKDQWQQAFRGRSRTFSWSLSISFMCLIFSLVSKVFSVGFFLR